MYRNLFFASWGVRNPRQPIFPQSRTHERIISKAAPLTEYIKNITILSGKFHPIPLAVPLHKFVIVKTTSTTFIHTYLPDKG